MARRAIPWTLAALALTASTALALEVGDKAPPIPVKDWVSNTPVTLEKAKGKVLVVEFWATWCGPCKVTIPHLNKLHARFGDDQALIVGVSNETVAKVEEFVKTTPMHYHVGVAGSKEAYGAYMEGVRGIPHAFVVDKQGTVVWKGHPMMGLDGVVSQLVKGSFDPAKAEKMAELQEQLQKARSFEQAYAALDAMMELAPGDPQPYRRKIELLGRQGKEAEAHALTMAMAEACADNPDVLAEVAADLATTPNLEYRRLEKALALANQAATLTKGSDAEVLAVQARCHYELGHLDQAVAIAQKAVAQAPEGKADSYQAAADFYKAERARRAQDPQAKL